MKILLIYPPVLDISKYRNFISIAPFPMVGLYYLSSFLNKFNYNCKVYDFFSESWDHIECILKEEDCDIIGINCLTESRFSSFRLLSLIKKIKKDTIVIFGGHHATHMCDQLLNNFNIDYIVLGEGENKLLNLVRAIERGIPLESLRGIAYKKKGVIIKDLGYASNSIIDLDSLPFPFSEQNRELFRKYPDLKNNKSFDFKHLSNPSILSERYKGTIIISSRGCPFNCQFCGVKQFWGKGFRLRSSENVVDEIEYYNKTLGFTFFKIWDYAFTLNPKRTITICQEIQKRKLKVLFSCQTRADRITEEIVFWLKKAGCISIGIGVESGSKKILSEINKKISIKAVINAFSIFKKYDLPAYPLLMVGNPGENHRTIKQTINLMKIIKPYKIVVQKTMVFPGTDLCKLAKKQGFIDDNYWLTAKPQPYYTFENSLKTLKNWEFEILNYEKKKYQLKLLKLILKLNFVKDYLRAMIGHNLNAKSSLIQIYQIIINKIIKIFHIKNR